MKTEEGKREKKEIESSVCLNKHRRNTFKVTVREKRGNESEGDRVIEGRGGGGDGKVTEKC